MTPFIKATRLISGSPRKMLHTACDLPTTKATYILRTYNPHSTSSQLASEFEESPQRGPSAILAGKYKSPFHTLFRFVKPRSGPFKKELSRRLLLTERKSENKETSIMSVSLESLIHSNREIA